MCSVDTAVQEDSVAESAVGTAPGARDDSSLELALMNICFQLRTVGTEGEKERPPPPPHCSVTPAVEGSDRALVFYASDPTPASLRVV